jgi:hypothetical protein
VELRKRRENTTDWTQLLRFGSRRERESEGRGGMVAGQETVKPQGKTCLAKQADRRSMNSHFSATSGHDWTADDFLSEKRHSVIVEKPKRGASGWDKAVSGTHANPQTPLSASCSDAWKLWWTLWKPRRMLGTCVGRGEICFVCWCW